MRAEADNNINDYLDYDDQDRFEFLYGNFSILASMIENYRSDLIQDVMDMKAFNHRAANGDTGVRIKISVGLSRPTERKAITDLTVAKAIDDGYLDEAFFDGTDDREELIRRVTLYHTINKDYDSFCKRIKDLRTEDQRIIKPYLMRQKSISDIAEEMGVEYRSALKTIGRIKKKLSVKVEERRRKGA